ncbi:MAG: DUF5723 family protein [Bacteroidetes bacterium]|nr:DUF5723 family protein [Bacteroidota bacterium]
MIRKVFTFLLFSLVVNGTFAQGLTMYNMDMIPQATRTNPGMMPKAKFHFGLPVLSYLDLGLVNNGFVFADFVKGSDFTSDNMLSKLQNDNYISFNMNLDLISFGFKANKKNYFSFNVTEKIAFNFDYSKNFMTLLTKGTLPFIGETVSMVGTGLRFSHYREFGLGYTHAWNNKLTTGIKLKMLQGLSNFNSEELDIALTTAADDYKLTATSTIGLRTAGLAFLTDSNSNFNPGSYVSNFDNLGMAVDLGANYKITDKISASFAATDLGAIQWKTNARRYYNNKAEFAWDGLDVIKYLSDSNNTAYTKNLSDSLTNIFGLKKQDYVYTTNIVGNIYLGGEYQFNKWFNAGLLFHGQLFAGNLYPSYTASVGTNLGSILQAKVSYSVLNRSYSNVGAAMALNLGPIQLYMAGDNVLGFSQIDYAKTLNLRLGVNIMTGYYTKLSKDQKEQEKIKRTLSKKDTDGDGVNDYEDKCIELAGLKEFKGCQDKDSDGIPDNEDICPTEPGTVGGCPDGDNDGIADRADDCPTQYGLLKGCPDLDKDSIRDADDACPSLAGTKAMKGCPDTDKDGISDVEDLCPQLKGSADHKGCPDTDGDGVFDNEDKCPNEKGTVELQGCTDKDSDHDSIPDVLDKCPLRVGPAENGGCPLE